MSNARILADLMGTSTTVPSSKLSLGAGDLPSGSVLQVVNHTDNTTYKQDGAGQTDCTNYNVSITPSSTSSKILIMMTFQLEVNDGNNSSFWEAQGTWGIRDVTNSTDLEKWLVKLKTANQTNQQDLVTTATGHYVHSPATTSQITYSVRLDQGTDTAYEISAQGDYVATLMEIAG